MRVNRDRARKEVYQEVFEEIIEDLMLNPKGGHIEQNEMVYGQKLKIVITWGDKNV